MAVYELQGCADGVLADSAGVPSASVTASTPVVDGCYSARRRPLDGAAVVASLRTKLVHCIDEQRHLERHGRPVEDFCRWFEQLVVTPEFVASIDRWT